MNPEIATQILETERLRLRPLTVADAGFMLQLLNEPAYIQFITDRGVRTLEDAQAYLLKGPIESYKRFGLGVYLTELKETATPLGVCGLIRRETLKDIDIGYAFLPQFWSNGYAFEAATAMLAYGHDALNLKRIVAVVSPDNESSIKLLTKLGLKVEHLIKWPEDNSDLKLFAIEY